MQWWHITQKARDSSFNSRPKHKINKLINNSNEILDSTVKRRRRNRPCPENGLKSNKINISYFLDIGYIFRGNVGIRHTYLRWTVINCDFELRRLWKPLLFFTRVIWMAGDNLTSAMPLYQQWKSSTGEIVVFLHSFPIAYISHSKLPTLNVNITSPLSSPEISENI